jgi:tryptophan-rich hypothetical protein
LKSTTKLPSPRKLLLSKWTAVRAINQEKNFLVTKVYDPRVGLLPKNTVEIEAILSKKRQIILWDELKNQAVWIQGWK